MLIDAWARPNFRGDSINEYIEAVYVVMYQTGRADRLRYTGKVRAIHGQFHVFGETRGHRVARLDMK